MIDLKNCFSQTHMGSKQARMIARYREWGDLDRLLSNWTPITGDFTGVYNFGRAGFKATSFSAPSAFCLQSTCWPLGIAAHILNASAASE